jgi:uncharacterized membrane protein
MCKFAGKLQRYLSDVSIIVSITTLTAVILMFLYYEESYPTIKLLCPPKEVLIIINIILSNVKYWTVVVLFVVLILSFFIAVFVLPLMLLWKMFKSICMHVKTPEIDTIEEKYQVLISLDVIDKE